MFLSIFVLLSTDIIHFCPLRMHEKLNLSVVAY